MKALTKEEVAAKRKQYAESIEHYPNIDCEVKDAVQLLATIEARDAEVAELHKGVEFYKKAADKIGQVASMNADERDAARKQIADLKARLARIAGYSDVATVDKGELLVTLETIRKEVRDDEA